MIFDFKVILYMISLHAIHTVDTQLSEVDGMIREYCQNEDFVASCNQDEVITMTTALYGSMKIGRCLEEDYGHLGCAADVLDIADRECSGKRECTIEVPNSAMDAARECPRDFTRYFEASYRCKSVFVPPYKHCTRSSTLKAQTTPRYLASLISMETGCGLTASPWTLQAEPGQQINISLTSFKYDAPSNTSQGCGTKYGHMFDLDIEQVINLCSGNQKNRWVYQSEGHQLQILLDKEAVERESFIISYQTIGCPDINQAADTWSKRTGDTLSVGCQHSEESWTLKCRGNHWIGLAKNCRKKPGFADSVTEKIPRSLRVKKQDLENHGQNLLIVTVVGCVTLFSCVVIVVTGIVCIKRLNKRGSTSNPENAGSVKMPANRNSVLTTYLPVFNPSQQNTMATVNRNQPAPCLLSHQSSGREPCVCETQTYKSASDRDSVQYYVLDQDYMANNKEIN